MILVICDLLRITCEIYMHILGPELKISSIFLAKVGLYPFIGNLESEISHFNHSGRFKKGLINQQFFSDNWRQNQFMQTSVLILRGGDCLPVKWWRFWASTRKYVVPHAIFRTLYTLKASQMTKISVEIKGLSPVFVEKMVAILSSSPKLLNFACRISQFIYSTG